MARRFGTGAVQWTDRLPGLVDRHAREWGLEVGEPFPVGNSAATYRAVRAGERVVLKLSPDTAFLDEQTGVLAAFGPSGRVPRVLAAAEGAVLLEYVEGEQVWPGPAEFAALLADLHAAVPDPAPLARRRLRTWIGEFLDRCPPTGPVTTADLTRARARLTELAERADESVLLHGDLHQWNMVVGERIVVVDPKACAGEPEFDAVDYVLADTGVEARRDALLAVSDLRPDRLDDWCRALAPVVAVLSLRRGDRPGLAAELVAYARSR
jgi:streptomycin 6-kinase